MLQVIAGFIIGILLMGTLLWAWANFMSDQT